MLGKLTRALAKTRGESKMDALLCIGVRLLQFYGDFYCGVLQNVAERVCECYIGFCVFEFRVEVSCLMGD